MPLTNEDIAVDLETLAAPLEWDSLFAQAWPVHIEIGSGKGTFLVQQARTHPEINYLGIEWANKFYRYSVDRIRRRQLSNVRLLRTDARDFIARYLPDASVTTFHVYFPDPWPKTRHHKRRFFSPSNILQVARCLAEDGQLRTATDHADYFEVIKDVLLRQPDTAGLFEAVEFYPAEAADPGEWVGSNFERKYLKQGRNIYTLTVKKASQPKL